MIHEIDYEGLSIEFYFEPAFSGTARSAASGGDPPCPAEIRIISAHVIDPDEYEWWQETLRSQTMVQWCEDNEGVYQACVNHAEEERGAA